ncbi:hydrolase, alpha/beta fold domain containing protein [Acanthamoeba castellanii str. Neff]|uniref:Lipase n=1 Tax=Acanthamoeba castellanii (strain ATCC 30010 / Neff) TaxID=1257118 RepID=L8GUX6_ACACF|nr:hydrolase, alpha/beta fold domain containing protein [Acanthamoeba castellanii str. Neff]ELR16428.1 hydrolase, alpha/beta fold domain containing protein [Acanthamoeba castellanii str. Neff]
MKWTTCVVVALALAVVAMLASTAHAYPSNVTGIIRDYGYRCDDYWAETEDGYLLSLQRIYHRTPGARRGVVLVQHGLTDNANGFVLNPPDESLPFILADKGYEVWLGNNRGNGYSMRHKVLNPSEPAFWQFTYDEMAQYDLPANINFVLATSGAATLAYVGHSEGTIQAFAGFSANNSIADRVDVFVALAPVAYVGHLKVLLLNALSHLDPIEILLLLGVNEFNLPTALLKLIPDVCTLYPPICNNVLTALMGPSVETNQSRLAYYLRYEPNPTSVLNMIHWSQGADTDAFQRYDWGEAGNMKRYGQRTPPPYLLSQMPPKLPVALFTGGNDYLADPIDVARLKKELRPPAVFEHFEPTYSHVDFLWAEDANVDIYPHVLRLIQQYHH